MSIKRKDWHKVIIDGKEEKAEARTDIKGMGNIFEFRRGEDMLRFFRVWDGKSEDVTDEVIAALVDRNHDAQVKARTIAHLNHSRIRHSNKMRPEDWQDENDPLDKVEVETIQAGQKVTYRRQRVDMIQSLHKAGKLDDTQREKAIAIRDTIAAITRGLFSPARPMDGTRVDGRAKYRCPIDRMRSDEQEAYRRYLLWAHGQEELDRETGEINRPIRGEEAVPIHSPRNHKLTRLQLVLDIIWDGRGTKQVEQEYGLQTGQAIAHLIGSLNQY